MKRTRAQQPKAEEPHDPASATGPAAANPKPQQQRRAKQPRQPKAAGGAARTKPGAAGTPRAAASVAANIVAAANAGSAASSPGGPAEMAPTVPNVWVGAGQDGDADADAGARAVDWDLDDAGMHAAAAWWTWGVDEEKLLGWFPFVEEDFRCAGGRAADTEVAAFDHDIWSIW